MGEHHEHMEGKGTKDKGSGNRTWNRRKQESCKLRGQDRNEQKLGRGRGTKGKGGSEWVGGPRWRL